MTTVPIEGDAWRPLVAAAQQGNRNAADQLFRAHDSWLRSVIYGLTGRAELVEEIAQQVWMRAWERLASLADPSRLRPWLYAVARSVAMDECTRSRRLPQPWLNVGDIRPAESGDPERAVTVRETRTEVLRAIAELPATYREPFVLRHVENWSYADIAGVLDLTVEAVEGRLTRARQMLRAALKDRVS